MNLLFRRHGWSITKRGFRGRSRTGDPACRLAIHKDYRRKDYAWAAALICLRVALRASQDVGGMCVFTHPLDDAHAGYARWGFVNLAFDHAG